VIEYDDFVIQISPASAGEHTATVIKSPAGKGGVVRFPSALLDPAVAAGADVSGARGIAGPAAGAAPAGALPPREIGTRLFNALFAQGIAELFQQSYGTTTGRGRRLRVRLQLNVDDDSIRRLSALQWELLYQQSRDTFLVRSADVTLVRELDVAISAYPLQDITGPLRVLFVMSNPRGDLKLTDERAAIEAQLAEDLRAGENRRQLTPTFLENATFAALEDLLRKEDYHIIHFMGHGDLDAQGEGHLLFHDGARSGRDIGDLLKREKDTRLVTLNACQTAASSTLPAAQPFAGVAQALVKAGVPAVIAMQVPVSDKAAIAFSARLYSEIGRGAAIEEAVDSGRMRLHALAEDGEWATPVLLLRDVVPFPVVTDAPAAAKAAGDDPWGAPGPNAFRVFLAAPIAKLILQSNEIAAKLRAADGVRVVTPAPPAPGADPNDPLKEFRTGVQATLGSADLSVHLLGDSPGDAFTDDKLSTYVIEQLKVAIDTSKTSGLRVMVIIAKDALRGIDSASYKSFVDSLSQHYTDDGRFEQATVEARGMVADEVSAKVQRLRVARTAASPAAAASPDLNAYVDVLKAEAGLAGQLLQALNAVGDISRVTQAKSDGMRPPSEMEKEFARVLGENQLYVVLQGEADPPSPSPSHWAVYRWKIAQKTAVNNDNFAGVVALYRPQPAQGLEKFEIKLNTLPESSPARQALNALKEALK